MTRIIFILTTLLAVDLGASARAATLRCRAEARPEGTVVKVKDVADVLGADATEARMLGEIELFPTPAAGDKRFLPARQIQDSLLSRGVNLLNIELAGASQIAVYGPSDAAKKAPPRSIAVNVRQAETEASKLAAEHLARQSGTAGLTADVKFNDAQARQFAAATGDVQVTSGGTSSGERQPLTFRFDTATGPATIDTVATVRLPNMAVVAARNLSAGMVLSAADVRLETIKGAARSDHFTSIDDLVGKEVARSTVAGQVLDSHYVRRPILVRRGDAVTVYAKAAGVRVRTAGRAKEEGADGDLVTIESTLDRATFFARVSGPQEVEVLAQGATVAPTLDVTPPRAQPTTARKLSHLSPNEKGAAR